MVYAIDESSPHQVIIFRCVKAESSRSVTAHRKHSKIMNFTVLNHFDYPANLKLTVIQIMHDIKGYFIGLFIVMQTFQRNEFVPLLSFVRNPQIEYLHNDVTEIENHKPAFDEVYMMGEDILGTGGFAVVKVAHRILDNYKVAVKIFDRKAMDESKERSIRTEYSILSSSTHDGIVQALGLYEEADCFYLVMECADGGDLLDRIVAKTCYSEDDAMKVMTNLFRSLKHLHDKDITHGYVAPSGYIIFAYNQCNESIASIIIS